MGAKVEALYTRDYYADFFFTTAGSTVIKNQPYLSGNGDNFSRSFVNNLSPISFDYTQSPTSSVISQIQHICVVAKNKILVYGTSYAAPPANRVFELHEMVNNSRD